MSRGNSPRSRGSRGGPRDGPGRGRGRGRGSGFNRSRGRGRGGGGYNIMDEIDFPVQMWPDNPVNRGSASPRLRGRGNGGHFSHSNSGSLFQFQSRGRDSPRGRGRGYDNPSPRGRANGRGGSKLRPDAPLSNLLYHERPFLRPIIFVPSVHTRTLFQEQEEILRAVVEEVGDGEQSHLPTADRVSRVFSGGNIPRIDSLNSEDDQAADEGDLEEIDFNDLGKLLAGVHSAAQVSPDVSMVEEKFTGFFIDSQPASNGEPSLEMMDTSEQTHSAVPSTETMDEVVGGGAPGFYIDTDPSPIAMPSHPPSEPLGTNVEIDLLSAPPTEATGFYIDTDPSPVSRSRAQAGGGQVVVDRHESAIPLGMDTQEDDEIIVYVAPHPRLSKASSKTEGSPASFPSLPSTSVLTGTILPSSTSTSAPTSDQPTASTSQIPIQAPPAPIPRAPDFESVSFSFSSSPTPKKQPRQNPIFTVRSKAKAKAKIRTQENRAARKRTERRTMFGSFGAIMSEAQLHGGKDPQWEERRRDDSDVDWGDEDEDEDGIKGPIATGAEGMDVDSELEIDIKAMMRFAKGMEEGGSQFVTMDDIADEEQMRKEDGEKRDVGSSGDDDTEEQDNEADSSDDDEDELDAIVDLEEELMMGEPGGMDSSDDDEEDGVDSDDDFSDEDGQSPRTRFQARLERLRASARGKRPAHTSFEAEDSSEDDDVFNKNLSWAEEDDEFIAHIQTLLDENEDILTGRDRKERNKVFRAVRDGIFADADGFSPAKRRKDQNKDLPPELQAQWELDREKKAANKRARAIARLELAADPLASKKGGRKGRKSMLAAARVDPTITVIPNRIIDMVTLVQQIRRFISNIDGPRSMSLPPTNKETRKNIHEMAIAFNLKSQSKGKGNARYTTLTKSTRTGFGVDEKKVAKISRRGGARGDFIAYPTDRRDRGDRQGGKPPIMPRHREGDEVGKAAPKIGESNIGFKMLALMGWTEGSRIGVTGGLDAPLTAVIKNTKLGLGATK